MAAANVIALWKGAVEPAESGASGNEIQAWKGAVEPAAALITRRGGVRWLREPDPEKRQGHVKELETILKPAIRHRQAITEPQERQETPIQAIMATMPRLTRVQQTEVEKLLQQSGISMDELIILLQ